MTDYCTYFDHRYLTRGIALFQSLQRHSPDARLWVLCFDDETFEALTAVGHPSLRPIALSDFERGDEHLTATKGTRSTVEYYFTCTPSLPLFVLRQAPAIPSITYVDADLLFYSDPVSLIASGEGHSVTIIPHGFPDGLRHLEDRGLYNVGLVSFRNDTAGRACLERWRAECIEWCYDRVERGRYADQAYLDAWPTAFDGVKVATDPGAGLAPWNVMRFAVDVSGQPPTVDGRPLIFYHFQGFKSLGVGVYDLGLTPYGRIPRRLRESLYRGYLGSLAAAAQLLEAHGSTARSGASSGRHRISPRGIAKVVAGGQFIVSRRVRQV